MMVPVWVLSGVFGLFLGYTARGLVGVWFSKKVRVQEEKESIERNQKALDMGMVEARYLVGKSPISNQTIINNNE